MLKPSNELDPIFKPKSIAVVGASRSPSTIGHQILANLLEYGYTGAVYPVNPKADSVHSIKAYPTIAAVPDPIDLAVISVPKELVLEVAEQCGQAGVRGLVVITAGFREIGGAGVERERKLVEIVGRYGMRLVGPNCMGVLNTHPDFAMNATFAPCMPPAGSTAFLSQSGALGLSVLDYASEYGIGISQFASIGNKPDVSGNDLLLQWENDDAVSVILMYVENFGNPREFLEVASRITKKKPIIVLKSGRSQIGAHAAASHTGALAASDLAVDALLAQAGVLRAESVEELFDMAIAFGVTELPRSRRTAVLTNSGGPGILVVDALEPYKLELVELHPSTVERLKAILPAEASLRNPLDMIASATPSSYRIALESLLQDPNVDAVISIFVPPLGVQQTAVADAIIAAAAANPGKPVLSVLMGREGLPRGRSELAEAGIPAYVFPESAARGLAALNKQREWLQKPTSEKCCVDADSEGAARIVKTVQDRGEAKLSELEALELMRCYGIQFAQARLAMNADDAATIAEEVGLPVVMKIVSPDIVHKTDVGGVRVGLQQIDDVRTAYHEILQNATKAVPGARVQGVLVQAMVAGGRELIAGITRDPLFGPLIMFGLGGIYAEALRDVVFRIAPLSEADADDMINGIRARKIVDGMRGQPPVNRAALRAVLRRLSQMAVDLPQIEELDLNPLLGFADRVIAVDARVRVNG
ncbi:MAG TPA: acetate--CoA ligase family protein [Longimicrobiales bacterium]|nr:acetate--CoA ligase family protein [Longimicrobiales bacterium]